MQHVEREPQTTQDTPATAVDGTAGSTTALGTARLLANPRRVRRA